MLTCTAPSHAHTTFRHSLRSAAPPPLPLASVQRLMRQYFPGMGAGTLLERALARKVDAAAQELDALVVPVQIPAGGV